MAPVSGREHTNTSRKRKLAAGQSVSNTHPSKRRNTNLTEARVIAAQSSEYAFKDGKVDVDRFIKAREFEINALEHGIKRAKGALTTRAFQNVPRDLRRRTASHDAKRIPRRLRSRAYKELKEDNTPTGRDRQKKKSTKAWLRSDTSKILQKLEQKRRNELRKRREGPPAIKVRSKDDPLSLAFTATNSLEQEQSEQHSNLAKPPKPPAKFRKRQIHKSWLPTHLFHSKRARMTPPKEPLWRMAIPLSPTHKSYKPTHRLSQDRGCVLWDMSYMSTIGLEGPESSIIGLFKALRLGSHEPARFWDIPAKKWASGQRSWSGWIYERDTTPLEPIAPVTVVWSHQNAGEQPQSTSRTALIRVHSSAFLQLWGAVLKVAKMQKPFVKVEDLRFEIGSIELVGPASMEALFGALWPSKPYGDSKGSEDMLWSTMKGITDANILHQGALFNMTVTDPRFHYPPRKHVKPPLAADPQAIVDLSSVTNFGHQKQIFYRDDRHTAASSLPSQKAINRRKTLAPPGEYPAPRDKDPAIPVLLLAQQGAGNGAWTLLLPWKCVLPVWYCLMHFPLSNGGSPSFGGLDELRQVSFERQEAWFPADFPGTAAGKAWEAMEAAKRKVEWGKRPKGKRINWDGLKISSDRTGEIGLGWECCWQSLSRQSLAQQRQLLAPGAIRPLDSRTDGLATVKVNLISGGVPQTCARIYRLPKANEALREEWLSTACPTGRGKHRVVGAKPSADAPNHVKRRHLARSLLHGEREKPHEHPDVPSHEDLVGFITTGNFNLNAGRGTGLGAVHLDRLLQLGSTASQRHDYEDLCIVRNAGQTVGRLARWHFV